MKFSSNRRKIALAIPSVLFTKLTHASDFGKSLGYPAGWGPPGQKKMQTGWPDYLVGNFSTGFEKLFDFKLVKAPSKPSPLLSRTQEFKLNLFQSLQDYQEQSGKPAILIAKRDCIYYEHYAFDRTAEMRFNGKSMAKSVVALLAGVAFDMGLFNSLDDPIQKYDGRLKGKPLGAVTLRQALNMSSGVDICRSQCTPNNHYERFERDSFAGAPQSRAKNTDHDSVLINWSYGVDTQSNRYNYNPIDPQLIAMAIRGATKTTLSEFTQKALWEPIGARADASWLVDSKGVEHAPAGFNATLQDWGRIGLLVAQSGSLSGNQIISESWLNECKTFGASERRLMPGQIKDKPRGEGYKFFFHRPQDQSILRFGGDFSQSIFADTKNGLAVVILSITNSGKDYERILESAQTGLH